jgi:hypothetical protein
VHCPVGRTFPLVAAEIDDSQVLEAPESAADVKNLVARLIREVSTGKVNPRTAAGLVPLLNLSLRAIEIADLDVRLRKLEQAGNR